MFSILLFGSHVKKSEHNSANNIENLLTYLLNLLYYISTKKEKEGFK